MESDYFGAFLAVSSQVCLDIWKLALGDVKVTKALVQDDTQVTSFSSITADML